MPLRTLAVLIALAAGTATACAEPTPPKPAVSGQGRTYRVPYRLLETKHVLVRVKVNGKGPFNLILDTGAPATFLSAKAAEKAGVEAAARGLSTIARFDIESGPKLERVKARVENLFQLDGMNGLGISGVELHGVIGANVLARYRIEYDFTDERLTWTRLNYEPPALNVTGGVHQSGLESMAGVMKVMGFMLGTNKAGPPRLRGMLGLELAEGKAAVVARVWPGGVADRAGVKAGDRVLRWRDAPIESADDLVQRAARVTDGQEVGLVVERGGEQQTLTLTPARGF
jgi:hypothetical protein